MSSRGNRSKNKDTSYTALLFCITVTILTVTIHASVESGNQ